MLRLTGTLNSPTNLFLSQSWAPSVNTLNLVQWVRILVGVGLHGTLSSGSVRISRLWKWSSMTSDTVLATHYVNENINTSLQLYLVNDVQGKFPCCRFTHTHTHTNKGISVPTCCICLYDLSNEYTLLFTMATVMSILFFSEVQI
jgi:hypothetical protein